MYATLLCLALAANPPQTADQNRTSDQAGVARLDGNWTIVCLEKDGQPVADAKDKTVMVKDGTFTCSGKDGKPGMIMKIDFADKGQVSITEIQSETGTRNDNAEKKAGVYVLTNDYLAVCLHDENAAGGRNTNATSTAGTPQSKSKCTVIMKREGTSNTPGSNPNK
jgi:uncharacterized protein (TIGR03067 family)